MSVTGTTNRRASRTAVYGVVLMALVACLPDKNAGDSAAPQSSPDAGADVGRARIGPGGGDVDVGGGLSISVPAGALTADVEITATFDYAGAILRVLPDLEFVAPVRVNLPAQLVEPSNDRVVLRQISGAWHAAAELPAGATSYEAWGFSAHKWQVVRTAEPCGDWGVGQWSGRYERQIDGVRDATFLAELHTNPSAHLVDAVAFGGAALAGTLTQAPSTKHGRACPVRSPGENVLVSSEVAAALKEARKCLRASNLGFDIVIHGGYDSSGCIHSSPTDAHSFGAAVDLSVCKYGEQGRCVPTPSSNRLLGAALARAGFEFIHYEDEGHVHAAKVSPSVRVTTPTPTKLPDRPSCKCGCEIACVPHVMGTCHFVACGFGTLDSSYVRVESTAGACGDDPASSYMDFACRLASGPSDPETFRLQGTASVSEVESAVRSHLRKNCCEFATAQGAALSPACLCRDAPP